MDRTVGTLIFSDLRQEQRRLAALIPINRVNQVPIHKTPRASLLPLPLPTYPCSHLDPDGTCRDPAHVFLHQHGHLKLNPGDILDRLREGFIYVRDRNAQLFLQETQSTLRGWTEDDSKFKIPLTSRTNVKGKGQHQGIKALGEGYESGSITWRAGGIVDESESDSEYDSEPESDEDKLHIKIPTENDARQGVRRLKGKNETKSRKRVLEKVKKYKDEGTNEGYDAAGYDDVTQNGERNRKYDVNQNGERNRKYDVNQNGERNGKYDVAQNGARNGRRNSDKHYDREVSMRWRDGEEEKEPSLLYNHGSAPNPVGYDYVNKLENGKIIQQRLFERTENNSREKRMEMAREKPNPYFSKERSGSFHRQTLSRKNRYEDESGVIRVTSFVSEPSFCHCSSPQIDGPVRESMNHSHDDRVNCGGCGKRVISTQRKQSSFASDDYQRESSGEFVRHRQDSGKHRRRAETPPELDHHDENLLDSQTVTTKQKRQKRKHKKIDSNNPDYMDNLHQRLQDGEFDIDLDNLPSVDDIDQTLHFGKDQEEEDEERYEQRFQRPPLRYDQYREAYLKALSVVRGRLLPTENWMLESNTTKSFVFSYFYGGYPKPRHTEAHIPPSEKPNIVKKSGAEMKMIFGSEKIEDYLPGGPKNLLTPQTTPRKTMGKKVEKKKKKRN